MVNTVPSFTDLVSSVSKLEGALVAMQVSGKATDEADGILDRIVAFVADRERFLVDRESSENAFAAYHAWRNLRLIFSKMKSRLAETLVTEGNRLVVDQAGEVVLGVLPLLPTLAAIEAHPSEQDARQVLEGVWRLRAVARRVNMAPSITEELKGVDEKELVRVLDSMLMPGGRRV
jgi:hypothetical protein